jgi:hypothetical protein
MKMKERRNRKRWRWRRRGGWRAITGGGGAAVPKALDGLICPMKA